MSDERFTHGLIFDVVEVLQRHGYELPGGAGESERHGALGRTVGVLFRLTRTFEGHED